jgi:hypothetical protein
VGYVDGHLRGKATLKVYDLVHKGGESAIHVIVTSKTHNIIKIIEKQDAFG